jgi:hypothetical protein
LNYGVRSVSRRLQQPRIPESRRIISSSSTDNDSTMNALRVSWQEKTGPRETTPNHAPYVDALDTKREA